MKISMVSTLLLCTLLLVFAVPAHSQAVPPGKQYLDMSRAERAVFIGEQARRIARELSGSEYEFTPEFEHDILRQVTQYAQRTGKTASERGGKSDLRLVFARGQANAPAVMAAFQARNLSPLFGLYLAWIESEFVNLEAFGPMGAIGMFQFLPATGERYGLTKQDLLDTAKSADAAARYIGDSLQAFNNDPMKEALAIGAYNQGAQRIARELQILLNDQNKRCSICALTADRSKVDEVLGHEKVFYVPRFFAAAIVGENPQTFGLQMRPLSSY